MFFPTRPVTSDNPSELNAGGATRQAPPLDDPSGRGVRAHGGGPFLWLTRHAPAWHARTRFHYVCARCAGPMGVHRTPAAYPIRAAAYPVRAAGIQIKDYHV